MRRDFRAVAGELSLLGSLQRKDSSPCTGLRVGRKLHGLPHDTLHGWRKVARFQADEPPPRGACVGPHELSVSGACAGVFKGLLFSSVPATALVFSPSLRSSSPFSLPPAVSAFWSVPEAMDHCVLADLGFGVCPASPSCYS